MAKAVTKLNAPKTLKGVVDDGTRKIPLVNKFGKLICNVYIRPADLSILDRYKEVMKDFDEIVKPLENVGIKNDGTAQFDKDWNTIKEVETELKKRIDILFDMEEADEIFAKRNPFSSVGGEFFCAKILTALEDVIVQAIEEEAELSAKRTSKYLTAEPENPEVKVDAGETAENA